MWLQKGSWLLRYGLHGKTTSREILGAQSKSFLVFTDLKKAYDSVLRVALWRALGKLGVADNLVELRRSFHCDMQDRID